MHSKSYINPSVREYLTLIRTQIYYQAQCSKDLEKEATSSKICHICVHLHNSQQNCWFQWCLCLRNCLIIVQNRNIPFHAWSITLQKYSNAIITKKEITYNLIKKISTKSAHGNKGMQSCGSINALSARKVISHSKYRTMTFYPIKYSVQMMID